MSGYEYKLAGLFAATLIASLATTPLMRALALKLRIVDRPDELKIHHKPIAYLGGASIVVVFLGGVLVGGIVIGTTALAADAVFARMIGSIVLAALMVFGVGLLDDIRKVSPFLRLCVHTIAAAIVVSGGSWFSNLGAPLLAGPFTVVFIVVCINAMNLLDGMDGLASGVAVVASGSLAILAFAQGDHIGAVMAISLVGALAGFLYYNFHPASIFLGDAGSGLLGLVLAILAVNYNAAEGSSVALPVALLILAIPLLDTSMAIWRRLSSGRSLSTGDRRHLYDVLLDMGMSQYMVWAGICGSSAIISVSAIALARWPIAVSLAPILAEVVVLAFFAHHLRLWRFADADQCSS